MWEVALVLGASALLLSLGCFILLYFINNFLIKRSTKTIELIKESTKTASHIVVWIKENVKDSFPIEVLNHPELLSLFQKDQQLYDRICELNPEWRKTAMPPLEMHKHLIELAQGQYKQTH